jgi:hypothetical protein
VYGINRLPSKEKKVVTNPLDPTGPTGQETRSVGIVYSRPENESTCPRCGRGFVVQCCCLVRDKQNPSDGNDSHSRYHAIERGIE